jgi:hypothetical protein
MAKWGEFKWNSIYYATPTKWSREIRPFDYRVVVLDRSGYALRFLRKQVDTISWEYKREGGCGDMSLNLRGRFDDYGDIEADYEIQVWIVKATGSSYTKVYSGYVYDIIPTLDEKESVVIRCAGYSTQLDRVVIRNDDGSGITDLPYNQVQISVNDANAEAIVNNIIKNSVAPVTGIIFDYTKIETVSYAPDEFKVGDSASKLITELAALAGNYEWGVDVDKKFFFKAKSTTRGYNFIVGDDVTKYRPQESFSKIKNRVILKVKGETVFVLEREGDLAVDQQQTDEAGWQSFGTNAVQKIRQKFLPNKKSLSKIELKAQYQGFTEYLQDGDMEEYHTANWDVDGATTSVTKSDEIALDSLSLKVVTVFPGQAPTLDGERGYGAYQIISSLPESNYTLRFYYYISIGDMFCQLWDATNDVKLIETERYTTRNTWVMENIGFSIPSSYVGNPGPLNIELRFYSALRGVSTFYIDNVSLKPARDGVKLSINEDGETDELAYFVLDQEDWSGTISMWVMHYPMDLTKIHHMVLERTRALAGYGFDNNNYYQARRSS